MSDEEKLNAEHENKPETTPETEAPKPEAEVHPSMTVRPSATTPTREPNAFESLFNAIGAIGNLPKPILWIGGIVIVVLAIFGLTNTPVEYVPSNLELLETATLEFADAGATATAQAEALVALEMSSAEEMANIAATATADVGSLQASLEEITDIEATRASEVGQLTDELIVAEDQLKSQSVLATSQAISISAQDRKATLQAEEAVNAQATIEGFVSEIEAADETIREQSVLATSQAISINQLSNRATSQEELAVNAQATASALDDLVSAQATELANIELDLSLANDQLVIMATLQADSEQLAVTTLLLEEVEENIAAFEVEATQRNEQLDILRATATAQTDRLASVDALEAQIAEMEATATAQANVIATQQARLATIEAALGVSTDNGN